MGVKYHYSETTCNKKQMNEKVNKERGFYKPFRKARLSEETQEWLVEEYKNYSSWEKFFRELKKRYNKEGYGNKGSANG